jgi:beta-lactamase class A
MNSGRWTGINVDDTYIPASLMKVPLMVAFYKAFEGNPALKEKYVLLPSGADANANEYFSSKSDLTQGSSYTVSSLVHSMVSASDNNAATLLLTMMAPTALQSVYQEIALPTADETTETMSPKDYMRIFRILYNASYLERTSSRSALELLASSDFTEGLVAGVPQGTLVSHKFGERTVENIGAAKDTPAKRELHDCGIVYYPQHPYGICVMTEGTSFDDLASAIAQISSTAYSAVKGGLLVEQ